MLLDHDCIISVTRSNESKLILFVLTGENIYIYIYIYPPRDVTVYVRDERHNQYVRDEGHNQGLSGNPLKEFCTFKKLCYSNIRGWLLITDGRDGGATKWENRGSETFCVPPFKVTKLFAPPPPPSIWLKLQATA